MGDKIPAEVRRCNHARDHRAHHPSITIAEVPPIGSDGRRALNYAHVRSRSKDILASYLAPRSKKKSAPKSLSIAIAEAIYICKTGPHGCGSKCSGVKCMTSEIVSGIIGVKV